MRRLLARFSESEASNHTASLTAFITATPELKFGTHSYSHRFKMPQSPPRYRRRFCRGRRRVHDQEARHGPKSPVIATPLSAALRILALFSRPACSSSESSGSRTSTMPPRPTTLGNDNVTPSFL
jgi:hypothetical protein